MDKSNSIDCRVDDDDTDESISLNDLRLMFAKLQEIHSKDSLKESELRTKLAEMRSASIERKVTRLKDEIKEIKDRIEKIKKENEILSKFSLDGLEESQKNIITNHLDSTYKLVEKDSDSVKNKILIISKLSNLSTLKESTPSQTDLTFPPSLSSLNVFTISSSSTSSSSLSRDKQFNAQDAFIEIQLDRKRQLEDQLKQLKKSMWFEGPEVMLVKLDAYEKLINKASIRRRRKVQQRAPSQFDCYLEISDHLEKRPCLETSRPSSPTSTNNGNGNVSHIDDEVVQLIFTAPPKQTNGRGSHT